MPRAQSKTQKHISYAGGEAPRRYTGKKKWGKYVGLIRELHGSGKTADEILDALSSEGFKTKKPTLKYILRQMGISKKYTNARQRNFMRARTANSLKEGNGVPRFAFKDTGIEISASVRDECLRKGEETESEDGRNSPGIVVLPSTIPEEQLQSGRYLSETIDTPANEFGWFEPVPINPNHRVDSSSTTFDTIDMDTFSADISAGSYEPQVNYSQHLYSTLDLSTRSNSSFDDHASELFNNLNFSDDRTVGTTHLELRDPDPIPVDVMEIVKRDLEWWSRYYRKDYEDWISLRRKSVIYIRNLIEQEHQRSGESYEACRAKIQEKWEFPAWDDKWVTYEIDLLPAEIHDSFFITQPAEGYMNPVPTSPSEVKESQDLRRIFNANIESIVDLGLPFAEEEPEHSYELKSQAFHLFTIEREFGAGHYFLVQAMFRLSAILHRIEILKQHTPASRRAIQEDITTVCMFTLAKLDRLNLRYSREAARVLTHLAQVRERMGDIEGTLKVAEECHRTCQINGMSNPDYFHRTRMMVQKAKSLCKNGNIDNGVNLLRQAYNYSTSKDGITEPTLLGDAHGFLNDAYNFQTMAQALEEIGYVEEAIPSYEQAMYNFDRAGNTYRVAFANEVIAPLARAYTSTGDYRLAMDNYERYIMHRTKIYGESDPLGIKSRQAIHALMNKVGYRFYQQPEADGSRAVTRSKNKVLQPYRSIYSQLDSR